jgi:predicted O-methyltransferase YrrM
MFIIQPSNKSKEIVQNIKKSVGTFHEYHHILLDIAWTYPEDKELVYVEIGCYAGASACLMLQRPFTKVFSIDSAKNIYVGQFQQSVNKWNVHNNEFQYIIGNSHIPQTSKALKGKLKGAGIDILFIDGGHSLSDVLSDFEDYKDFINPNGFIVFDDYHDKVSSPEVRKAIDSMVLNNKFFEFDILPTLQNEFILRKK